MTFEEVDVALWNPLLSCLGMERKKWSGGLGCLYECLFVLWFKRLKDIRETPLFQPILAADPADWLDPAAETRAVMATEMRRLWFGIFRGSESLDSIGDPRTMAEQFWWNFRYCVERKLWLSRIKGNRFFFIACDSLPFLSPSLSLFLSFWSCLFFPCVFNL